MTTATTRRAGRSTSTRKATPRGRAQAPAEALVDKLNRSVRTRTARLTFVGDEPFGDALRVQTYRLGNGLEVHLLVDHSAPVVSYQTWFRVGSRHEKKGKTGLAHLFEHLMFNETKTSPAGEFDRVLEAAGGETNAATWTDWTYYYENVPARELGLAIRLEADRMANLVLRDPQVSSEKEVVANERRLRVDDDVEGAVGERLYAMAFKKHPYGWPTIGWMRDIEGFTTADCRGFYKTYYAPNNAVVVIAGSFDPKGALSLVQAHYGKLSASKIPPPKRVKEPAMRRQVCVRMKQPTPTDKLQLGYHAPAFGDRDWAVLTVANEVLVGGRSSRLYRRLVNETEVASEVRASLAPFRDPGLFDVWVGLRPGQRIARAQKLVDAELAAMGKKRVAEDELEKAKARLELGFLQGMETASGKAEQIGFYATVLGEPSGAFRRVAEYRAVTSDDVMRVCHQTFGHTRRVVIEVEPQETEKAPRRRAGRGARA